MIGDSFDESFVTVYLIHLDRPLQKSGNNQASHYCGSARHLEGRLHFHRKGKGSKFLAECNKRGISYAVAADWPATRQMEMAMKATKDLRQFCPVCMGAKAKNPLVYPFACLRRCSHLPEDHPVILAQSQIETPLFPQYIGLLKQQFIEQMGPATAYAAEYGIPVSQPLEDENEIPFYYGTD